MDLKIFPVGFSEKEFNNFCNVNLIYKYHVIDNGSIYIFYKNPNDLGKKPIELAEDIDRVVKQAQTEILAYEIDKEGLSAEIAKFNEEKNTFHSNQDEWKKLDKNIKDKELSIKMADDTIKSHNQKIEGAKSKLVTVLSK